MPDAKPESWVAPRATAFALGVALLLAAAIVPLAAARVACAVAGVLLLLFYAVGYLRDAHRRGIPDHDRTDRPADGWGGSSETGGL